MTLKKSLTPDKFVTIIDIHHPLKSVIGEQEKSDGIISRFEADRLVAAKQITVPVADEVVFETVSDFTPRPLRLPPRI